MWITAAAVAPQPLRRCRRAAPPHRQLPCPGITNPTPRLTLTPALSNPQPVAIVMPTQLVSAKDSITPLIG